MARDARLGGEREAVLRGDRRLRYREVGDGPPVLFVHGVLVNGDLWRDVVPAVAAAGFRCVTVDLPLGAHGTPMPRGTDLTPPGVAGMIEEFLDVLDLSDVTIVGNDTGGAIVQVLMARQPDRVGRVVLTSSDSLERFFPPLFRFLHWLGFVPGGAWLVAQTLRIRAVRRLPIAFGWVAKRPLPEDVVESFLAPALASRAVRRDLRAFLRGVHPRFTLAAARHFESFDRPVLLAWSREDRVFPLELAYRLADLLPRARVVPIDDAYTFSPLDQPGRVAELVTKFAGDRGAGERSGS